MLFNFRSILYVSLLPSWAAAGVAKVTPELSLGMTTSTVGSDSEFGGIEPIMKWTAKGNAADIDMEVSLLTFAGIFLFQKATSNVSIMDFYGEI